MKTKTGKLLTGSLLLAGVMLLNAFCDSKQDKDTYKSVKIGNQEWMTENLNVNTFCNGDLIPHAATVEEWDKARQEGLPAWCYYDSDPVNEEKYGKVYNWYAVNDVRGLAPEGWHVPDDAEWTELTDYLGGIDVAGIKIKNTSGWSDDGNGTNESGFLALPGGFRDYDGSFQNVTKVGYWWTSTENDNALAWFRSLWLREHQISRFSFNKEYGLSVRCLRD